MITKSSMMAEINNKANQIINSELIYIEAMIKQHYKGTPFSFYLKVKEEELTSDIKKRIIAIMSESGWVLTYEDGGSDVRDGSGWPGKWVVS